MFKRFKDQLGATGIEYGILSACVAVAIISSITLTGTNVKTTFCNVASAITSTSPCGGTGFGQGATYSDRNTGGSWCTKCYTNLSNLIDGSLLAKINSADPITSIYGLQDGNHQNVTNYTDAVKLMNTGTSRYYGVTNPVNGQTYQYEVQTQSGKQYAIQWDGASSLQTIDLSTGTLVHYDVKSL